MHHSDDNRVMFTFFVPRSGCKSLEVLQLSQVKVSDRGVQHLLHQPLEHLVQLDLSSTLISSRTLALLPNGKLRYTSVRTSQGFPKLIKSYGHFL